jgi:hypothetical protein
MRHATLSQVDLIVLDSHGGDTSIKEHGPLGTLTGPFDTL